MKRKIILPLLFGGVAISGFSSVPTYAELWQAGGTHAAGDGAVGVFGNYYFSPNSSFNIFSNVSYGITSSVQAELALGFGSAPTYVGGFLKTALLRNKIISIALWGGIHHQGSSFIDIAPIFSHSFSALEIYAAPLFLIQLDNGGGVPVAFVPGIDLPIAHRLRFYSEFTLNLNQYYNAFGAGVRYFF